MTLPSFSLRFACLALALVSTGCSNAPGKPREPGSEQENGRPDQVASFTQLYKQNCAGCHGAEGRGGAAISLANPVYLATAGEANIQRITGEGVAGTMMPAFGKKAGGMLTDHQIAILAQGMLADWGNPGTPTDARVDTKAGLMTPAYRSSSPGDPVQGHKTFAIFCARCHGADAAGIALSKSPHTGSIVDPAYLALISDQNLRSTIIAGWPERGMPDWRSDQAGTSPRAMTDQEITDAVAWLVSHRVATPGQPYPKSQ